MRKLRMRSVAAWETASELAGGLGPRRGFWDVRRGGVWAGMWAGVWMGCAPALAGAGGVAPDLTGRQAKDHCFAAACSNGGAVVVFAVPVAVDGTTLRQHVFARDTALGETRLVTRNAAGEIADAGSMEPDISGDGRVIALTSSATNLVAGDRNGLDDLFIFGPAGGVVRVMGGEGRGAEPDGHASSPRVSADGRWVAFASVATNLVPGDTNGARDVFVVEVGSGVIERVSVGAFGVQGNYASGRPTISADGRFVAFESLADNLLGPGGDGNRSSDVFVHDRASGETVLVSRNAMGRPANAHSTSPSISANGDLVAFESWASDLVSGPKRAGSDVYLADVAAETVVQVSVAVGGAATDHDSREPVISADGAWVAYSSLASNIVEPDTVNGFFDVLVWERATGVTRRVSATPEGGLLDEYSDFPRFAPDGRALVFRSRSDGLVAGDANRKVDVFRAVFVESGSGSGSGSGVGGDGWPFGAVSVESLDAAAAMAAAGRE